MIEIRAHTLSVVDLAVMLHELQTTLALLTENAANEKEFRRILILLVNQAGDCTHASVETAAQILQCSTRSVHRRVKAGEYTLETIPGTKRCGIPVDQLSRQWCPIGIAKKARERQREQEASRNGQTPRR